MTLSERQHQREIFERASVGVLEVNMAGVVTYANPHACSLVGVNSFEGLDLRSFYEDPEVVSEQLANRRAGLIGNYRAHIIRQTDQVRLPVKVTSIPLPGPDGEVAGAIALFRVPIEEEINRLHQEVEDPDSVLYRVMQELRRVVPFDMVTATRFSDDLRHTQPFFVCRYFDGEDRATWRKKQWDALPPALAPVVQDTSITLIPDLAERLADPSLGALRETPLVQSLVEDGLQCCIRRPILRNNQLFASVTFYSRSPGGLSENDRERIGELPIAASVIQAIEHFDRKREQEQHKLLREIAFCGTVEAAYVTLLKRLCEMFAWPHAGVYRVDHALRRIKLVAVCNAPHAPVTAGLDYEQPIDKGILGRVVRGRAPALVPDIAADPDYVADPTTRPGKATAGSELSVPLGLEGDGKVRWIIDVEDPRLNAFSDKELRWFVETAKQVGGIMQRLSTLHFLNECLDHTSEPIVVVDTHGIIKRANPAAADIFRLRSEKELRGPVEALFQSPEDAAEAMMGADGFVGEFTLHRPGQDDFVVAGVSRKPLPDDIGGSIFVFKDMRPIRRRLELELLEGAAYEIALETRTPLMVAISQLERSTRDGAGLDAQAAELVLKYLYRTQHAYAKLAMFNAEVQAMPGDRRIVDLAAEVRAMCRWLPPEVAALVHVAEAEAGRPARVHGDCFQLAFVIETVLMFFVRTAPEEVGVIVTVATRDDRVLVQFDGRLSARSGSAGQPWGDDPSHSELRLAYPLISQYVSRNDGEYIAELLSDGRARHTLSFPVAGSAHAL
jgi:PAS domain-containing protein